ncbi:unnamed protein product [Clonostachys rosea]|uniref:CENP-V/GFA domain-containing protein n=1 Tax=Bionectria ochroleuca TaxID=29856 RepID=A0ABY6UR44_BIOOC|nr:unnamed protein product [Clonostachys rosea]
MASNTEPKMDITAQCLCKAHTFTASIPLSSLPLKASYCHCNSCRHVTGAMYSCDASWPGPQEIVLNSVLARYSFTQNVTVLFCATCSSPMFFHEHYKNRPEPESLGVFIGVLANHAVDNFVEVVDHIFVEDTIDGGATPWLTDINADGTLSKLWKGRMNTTEQLEAPWPGVSSLMKAEDKAGPDLIPLQCHCKGVNLVVRRMDNEFSKMKADGKELPWFVNPENLKHMCGFDPCDSCRSMFGVDMVHWTFVLTQQVEFAESTDKPFPADTLKLKKAILSPDRDPRLGTLSFYASSPDVQRYFCSRCSASVFYAVDDRPEMLDVAAGVLWAPEGARAESLLAWELGSLIGNLGDVQGGWREKYVIAVRRGAEKWRIQRGYPKSWKRINAEKQNPELVEDFKDL